jgi:hypothetical protein
MRIAFHAPLKPPDHPVPSGDRLVGRLLMAALKVPIHSRALIASLLGGCAVGWVVALTPNMAAAWPSVAMRLEAR